MALFLSDGERAALDAARRDPRIADFYWALLRRNEQRVDKPGLLTGNETVDWWRPVAEYVTDAAMAHALKPTDQTAAWLRDVTLSLVRRPLDDWVGPHYRNHRPREDGSLLGHLETAHFCWAVASVVDLAPDVLTDAERDEVTSFLRDHAAKMCLNWLDIPHSVANWWCVLTAGLASIAAVLGDKDLLARSREELAGCTRIFQADGSHTESLQYANYAIYTVMIAREALQRCGERVDEFAPIDRYIGYAKWAAASYLYSRPTSGWGAGPRPRSLNFNDSGAVFTPTADVLMHLSARAKATHPTEAGLARWLFDRTYTTHLAQGPHDQASFGLRTSWGFLTLPLIAQAAEAMSPSLAKLDTTLAFDCGNSIARDAWHADGGRTVLALHGGGPPLNGPGHLHRDMNTIILVHNDQRLLTDAGHSCYRNMIRRLETSTQMHNTCIFRVSGGADERMESWTADGVLEQMEPPRRQWRPGEGIDPPADRGARRLLTAECDDVRVIGSEAAATYGRPITRFARFAILCGPHAVFIVDHITSDRPVKTQWNWLLNNRDGELNLKIAGADRLVARRGGAGMKLFNLVGGRGVDQRWAHVNDAYHCMPGQMGEGRPGSGILCYWTEPDALTERLGIHAMALDTCGAVAGWHLRREDDRVGLEAPGSAALWTVQATARQITITEQQSSRTYVLADGGGDAWTITGPSR